MGDQRTISGDSGKSGGYTLAAGQVLGQYRIIRPLGKGGMGEVYEAEHTVLRKRYALKLLGAEMTVRSDAVERFEREAQVMANLEHPNVLAVDEFGQHEGRYWLRMKLAGAGGDVRSLEDLVRDNGGNLDADIWQMVMTRVLEGLAYAHERGVVHRDLKPSNILLSVTPDGKECLPVIADFGLARLVGEDWLRSQVEQSVRMSMSIGGARTVGGRAASAEGTSTRALLGTYEYMSPEQKRGEEATAASDIYAIGLMGYRLLTGRSPTLKKPSELVPGLSSSWDRWIGDCLEENPQDRPTAKQLLERMPAKMMGPPKPPPKPAASKPSSVQADIPPSRQKRRGVKLLLAAVLLALVAGVIGWVARHAPERFQVGRLSTHGDAVEKVHGVRLDLADLTPVQSEARVKWRRVQALDREQGFGELLDACEVELESANSFASAGDYPRALEAYRAVIVKSDEIHERESLRQAAVGAREQAAMARDRAGQVGAASEAAELWAGAQKVMLMAANAFEDLRFDEARHEWQKATMEYDKAQREAYTLVEKRRRIADEQAQLDQAYRKAKIDYETALGRLTASNLALLESEGGPLWREVLRQAAIGASRDDPVEGHRAYAQALAGLPTAVDEARQRKQSSQISKILAEARYAMQRKLWHEVVAAADRVLALDAKNLEAQELKREAERVDQAAKALLARRQMLIGEINTILDDLLYPGKQTFEAKESSVVWHSLSEMRWATKNPVTYNSTFYPRRVVWKNPASVIVAPISDRREGLLRIKYYELPVIIGDCTVSVVRNHGFKNIVFQDRWLEDEHDERQYSEIKLRRGLVRFDRTQQVSNLQKLSNLLQELFSSYGILFYIHHS